jgi:ribosomal protein S18 acetylase RimI-like enzyme
MATKVPGVSILEAGDADDPELVAELVTLVNLAYSEAERGIWTRDLDRTTADEVATTIAHGQLAAATLDGRFVGSVFTRLMEDRTGWFGALAVDPAFAGRGLGRKLVEFCEHHARAAGAHTMQLELLVPDHPHPHTDRLAGWYSGLGYRHVGDRDLAELDPGSVAFAVVPIRVSVMRKALDTG